MQVTAVAYDNPIPGYGTNNTINLRLWAAKPDTEFDLEAFNTGDYIQVIRRVCLSERKVLSPEVDKSFSPSQGMIAMDSILAVISSAERGPI